jgi:hypothetical protein
VACSVDRCSNTSDESPGISESAPLKRPRCISARDCGSRLRETSEQVIRVFPSAVAVIGRKTRADEFTPDDIHDSAPCSAFVTVGKYDPKIGHSASSGVVQVQADCLKLSCETKSEAAIDPAPPLQQPFAFGA